MSDPIIRRIVGRCHVRESNRQVIRYFVSRLRDGYVTYRSLSRQERHGMLRAVIAQHAENRKLYRQVTTGRF